jgi:phosphoribosylanthranilate isomerase
MQKVCVKICGIRSYEEAKTALDCGADFLGFNFWPKSPRYIKPIEAREIIRQLKPFDNSIGVFVNEERKNLAEVLNCTGIYTVQLHGDESPEYCQQFGYLKLIKAFRVGESFNIETLKNYTHTVGCYLLDAKVKGEYGGTGQRFDWQIVEEAKKIAPIFLAGGINIDNLEEAITTVRPFAIDVCSGVESEPGRKDLHKLRDFLKKVEQANQNL